jgi:hypothetical protein
MTKYLDEYGEKSKSLNKRAQSDTQKLKFNNVSSCVAIVLVTVGQQMMTGIHLTIRETNDKAKLLAALKDLQSAAGAGPTRMSCQPGRRTTRGVAWEENLRTSPVPCIYATYPSRRPTRGLTLT